MAWSKKAAGADGLLNGTQVHRQSPCSIPLEAHPTRRRRHPHRQSLSGSPALSPIFPRPLWRSRLSVIQHAVWATDGGR